MSGYKNPSFGKSSTKKNIMRPGKPETTQLKSPGTKPQTTPPASRPSTMRNLAPWKGFNPGKLS